MERTLTAFAGDMWIATGDEAEVREAVRAMGEDAQEFIASFRAQCEEIIGAAAIEEEAPAARL